MVFAQQPTSSVADWRDVLALWADVLGLLGFFVSLATVAVGLFIERRVRKARDEAKKAIADLGQILLQGDIGDVRHTLELSREASRSRQWVRAVAHLDTTVSRLGRLVKDARIGEQDQAALRTLADDARTLVGVMGKLAVGKGKLTDTQGKLYDRIGAKLAEIEGDLRSTLWGNRT